LSESAFIAHSKACEECQKSLAFEKTVTAQIEELRTLEPSTTLWPKVRAQLIKERQKRTFSKFNYYFDQVRRNLRRPAWQAGFVVGIIVLIAASLLTGELDYSKKYLSNSALNRVEKKELEYEEAITDLEKLASAELTSNETDLFLLYRDKIETLNAQIAQCKEALENNPYSVHIRRYLLAAYQEKKETLAEVLQFSRLNAHEGKPVS
jgi:hypothetical protein